MIATRSINCTRLSFRTSLQLKHRMRHPRRTGPSFATLCSCCVISACSASAPPDDAERRSGPRVFAYLSICVSLYLCVHRGMQRGAQGPRVRMLSPSAQHAASYHAASKETETRPCTLAVKSCDQFWLCYVCTRGMHSIYRIHVDTHSC